MATALDPTAASSSRPPGYFSAPLPPNSAAGDFYRANGFLVVEGVLSPNEVAALNADAAAICRGDHGVVRGVETGMTQPQPETDDETLARFLCIHFPHKISPLMREMVSHPGVVDVLKRAIGPDIKCMQSMLFIKSAGKPGQAWHQDEAFIPTRDRSLCGAWIALDDATVDNGCLWVIPGSHRPAILWPQHDHNDRRFDCAQESEFPWKDEDAVVVEVPAGGVVFFDGYLLHRSLPNIRKTGYRRSLVNHYMSTHSLLPWTATSEGPRVAIADKRDIIVVAGQDPYAYKGTVSHQSAFVRPSGEGGCLPGVKPADAAVEPAKPGGGQMGGVALDGGMMGGGMSGKA